MLLRVLGAAIGQASGLKMCDAALTKGLTALATALLVAGESQGLAEPLRAELRASQGTLLGWIERQVPGMPPKAGRWVGEMEEIAAVARRSTTWSPSSPRGSPRVREHSTRRRHHAGQTDLGLRPRQRGRTHS